MLRHLSYPENSELESKIGVLQHLQFQHSRWELLPMWPATPAWQVSYGLVHLPYHALDQARGHERYEYEYECMQL